MIKFFRKIRQNSIKENKFTNYLKYAIGEIVLVVIGILIALSINNWNNYNKERIAEQKLLQSLLTEYRSNLNRTQLYWINFRGLESHLQDLLGMIGSEDAISKIEFIDKIAALYSAPNIDIDLSISKATINSGRQSIIQSEQLKNNLQLMIPSVERFMELYSQILEELEKMKNDPAFPIRQLRYPAGYGDAGPSKFQSDLRKLLSEPAFESQLENVRIINADILKNCHFIHSNLEQTIMQLEAELTDRFNMSFQKKPTPIEPILFPFTDYNRPFVLYSVWGYPIFPRWRNFKDSLLIEFRANNKWGGFSVDFGHKLNGERFGKDYSKYSKIRLTLKTEESSGEIKLGMKDTDDENANSGEEAVLKLSDQWQTFDIELDQYLSFNPKRFNYLKLIYDDQAAMNLYVKQIEFLE